MIVAEAHTPATFNFIVKIDLQEENHFIIEVDNYIILTTLSCEEIKKLETGKEKVIFNRNIRENFSVSEGWKIEYNANSMISKKIS